MRTQYCRLHIDQVAEECGIEDEYVQLVKDAANFAEENTSMLGCSTRAIQAVIRIRDPEVKDTAIVLVEKALNMKTPTGGKINESLTETQIRTFIDRATKEVESKRAKEIESKRKDAEKIYAEAKAVVREEHPDPDAPIAKVMTEMDRLAELLDLQTQRREVEIINLGGADKKIEVKKVELEKRKDAVKEVEREIRDIIGYKDTIRQEIANCDKNLAQIVEQMNKLKTGA